MKLQQLLPRLISNFAKVLLALFVPFYAGSAVETYLGAGFVTTSILAGVLWFLASIVLGLRIGSWWALLLAVIAVPLVSIGTALIIGKPGEVFEIPEFTGKIWAMISLTWLVGLAVGVIMRKVTGLWGFTW